VSNCSLYRIWASGIRLETDGSGPWQATGTKRSRFSGKIAGFHVQVWPYHLSALPAAQTGSWAELKYRVRTARCVFRLRGAESSSDCCQRGVGHSESPAQTTPTDVVVYKMW
jgi:hypothetical protein